MSEVVTIGEEQGKPEHVVVGLEHVASSLAYMTRFEEALEKGLQGLKAARESGNREHEAGILTSSIPFAHIRNGDFAAAQDALLEGVEIASRIGALFPMVDGNWLLASICRMQGDYEVGLEYGKRSLDAALPLEDYTPFEVVLPLGILGLIYLDISPQFTDKIAEVHRHALRLLETPAGAITGSTVWADLGFCAITLNDYQLAEECFKKGLDNSTIFSFMERARLLAGSALLALEKGERDKANRLIDEARVYAEERGMRQLYPLIELIAGKVYTVSDQVEKGLQSFNQAEALALPLNMRPMVWQARAAAADSLSGTGQVDAAEEKLTQAQEMIEEIASLFKDENLQNAFLQNARSMVR
jgi:tetratricopeptide (TPR) repeat protein